MYFSKFVMFITISIFTDQYNNMNSISVFSHAKRLASHNRCNKDVCLEHIYIEQQLKNSSDVV